MASAEFGTGKSIVVLAVVVGCFAVLWPKIFYPMMQTAFSMTAPKIDPVDDSPAFGPSSDRPPHLHPGLMNPHLRESMSGGPQSDRREGRPFPHPSSRQPVKPQPKSGGAMSIIMPIYTIGIVVFFLYTVLKLVFKKSDSDKKPMIKDFHMDPEYHKFVCQEPPSKAAAAFVTKEKLVPSKKPKCEPVLEKIEETFDEKDYEILKLRKKLEETESAMERIMKHMGVMSECLSKGMPLASEEPLTENQATLFQKEVSKCSSTIRQRNPCMESHVDKNNKEKLNCDRERSTRKLVGITKEDLNVCDLTIPESKEELLTDDLCEELDAESLKKSNTGMKSVHSVGNSRKCRAVSSVMECFDDSDSNNDESDDNKENQSCSSPGSRLSPSSFTAESCSEESLHIDEDTDENMPLLIDESDLNQAKIMCKCGSQ